MTSMFVDRCKVAPMSQTIKLPDGDVLVLPELPRHHHDGPCGCVLAVGYIRVSDLAGRGVELVSPQLQLDSMVPWCRQHNRRLVKLIFDIDKSGQTFENRSLDEVLQGVRSGAWKTIAMWKWSRWSRETAEALLMVKRVEAAGGEVRACTEDMDPSDSKAPFMRGLHLLLAEERGREIGESWRGVHQNRRVNGLPHSGRPRFGYQYREVTTSDCEDWPNYFAEKDEGRRRYVPDANLGDLLKSAYLDYTAGASMGSMVKAWNARGIRTTLGQRWSPQSLGKMLDTGFAAGLIRYRTKPPAKKPANTLSSYDGWDVGGQPPLITIDEWTAYRTRRESQADLPPRSRTAVHSASALLYCGICGCRISTAYQGAARTHQWRCKFKESKHPETHVGISNEMILDHLRNWVAVRGPEDYSVRVRQEAERLMRQEQAVVDIERIQAELRQIEKVEIANLIRLQMRGSITDEEFDMMKSEADEKAKVLRRELKAAEENKPEEDGKFLAAVGHLADSWEFFRSNPAGHRELLGTVIAGVLVFPGKGKAELASRVKVFPAWKVAEFSAEIEALRAAPR